MSHSICVRFAPSPTGPLHIGGVRTALFNWLLARQKNGRFMLRMEDTDRERSKPEFEASIIESLKWLGLSWYGDASRQSERLTIYREKAEELVSKGVAYRDQGAVKFKVLPQIIEFEDLVHGTVKFDSKIFEDFVILKSDGYPAYNFACVIDDHYFEITHVIRGDDHLSNTPKQILMYRSFGWRWPEFAHLPLVLGKDGTPLSKRDAIVDLNSYRREGFLPEALLNYLALLGWSPGGNREFLTPDELLKLFGLKRINKTGAMFDMAKLKWLNAEHLRRLNRIEYIERLKSFLKAFHQDLYGRWNASLEELACIYQSRIQVFEDWVLQTRYYHEAAVVYSEEAVKKYMSAPKLADHLRSLAESFSAIDSFNDETACEKQLRETAAKLGVEARELIHPIRVALTGQTVSPSLFSVMRVLGKDRALERIRRAVDFVGRN